MAIDLQARRSQLQAREKELSQDLGSSDVDAVDTAPMDEASTATDDAVADEERDLKYAQADRDSNELVEVRDALQRIDAGTYGKCTACGRAIAAARLDAVPATKYCIDDAREREPGTHAATL